MKKILVIAGILMGMLSAESQTIAFNEPKLELEETGHIQLYTVKFSIKNYPSTLATIVRFSDRNTGIATAGLDYTLSANAGKVACADGTGSFDITVLPDKIEEDTETVVLAITIYDETGKTEIAQTNCTINIIEHAKAVAKQAKKAANKLKTANSKWSKDESNVRKYELTQYTDLLGFQNDKPNGLLQQQFLFKWPIIKSWYGKGAIKFQPLRSVVFPDLLFNRIDKGSNELIYAYKPLQPNSPNPDSSQARLTTMNLLKYSNLLLSGKVNLLCIKFGDNFRLYADYGMKLLRNRPVYDTSGNYLLSINKKITDFRQVYSIAHAVELYGKTVFPVHNNNIGFDCNVGLMWLYLHDSYYNQYDATKIDPSSIAIGLAPVNNSPVKRHSQPIFFWSARLEYNMGTEKQNAIFFRANYFSQTGSYNEVYSMGPPPVLFSNRFYDHYIQLQLGYTLSLGTLFQAKKSDDKTEAPKSPGTVNSL